MDLGRVLDEELNKVDFSLKPDPALNKSMLNGKPAKKSKFYFSAVKWGRTDLVGKIYPPEANEKEKDSLDYYINNYYSVALNATHYKVYGEAGIKKCAALVYKMDREMGFDLSKMTFIEKQRRFFD